jgi:cytidyltransferase-like protein
MIRRVTGSPPKFPFQERSYFLSAVRFVKEVVPAPGFAAADAAPETLGPEALWVDLPEWSGPARADNARGAGMGYQVVAEPLLAGFPASEPGRADRARPGVVVTGCYDWFHSGHVRFFEEASAYGDLFVIVGHDANIRLLKGEGHPLLSQEERRFLVSSVRFVKEAFISSGEGWLDADPEIQRLRPRYYVVNEDGDKGGKRDYCRKNGIEYMVLKRAPAPGLPRRSSTDLRGF